jgi:iron complex outermembrane receptor protein
LIAFTGEYYGAPMRGLHIAAIALASAPASAALAQAPGNTGLAPVVSAPPIQEVIVTADRVGLLEKKPSTTVFGLAKPLLETPRSATFVSDVTIQRYGAQTVNDLIEIAPGSFTASYYGVPGSLNLRGTLAENYFRGFKRIEDRGTYSTPIGDAAEIEIVRGPPTPIYGPGKVGGFLNFEPKTAEDEGHFLTQPTGEATLTYGEYNLYQGTLQGGAPVTVGPVQGGVYGYGEASTAHSYYHGIYPSHQMLELSSDLDFGSGWSAAFGGMYYHDDGDVQTPGWNRLTQNLIDNGTYITGRNTVLVDSNHDGRLEPGEVQPGGFYPYGTSLYQAYFGAPPPTDPRFVLDTGVGTTQLSPRTVFISAYDFSHTITHTYYADLAKDLGGGQTLKLQLFYDDLDNKRFVSYGFPAWYRAYAAEARLSYAFDASLLDGMVTAKSVTGLSDRYYKGRDEESYDSGLISLDRRDLSYGPTATDIFDDPFLHSPGGLQWETDIRSKQNDAGAFATTDIAVAKKLDLIVGGRFDEYHVTSADHGLLYAYDVPTEDNYAAGKGAWTYNASLSYKVGFGLMPYATYARESALEIGQAGDVSPNLIANGGWLSKSILREAGVKFQWLNGTLVGALDVYKQDRSQIEGNVPTVVGTTGKGTELEVRYLASKNLSFTFAGNLQHTEVKGPDHSLVYIPYYTAGVAPQDAFGGAYLVYDFSTLPGRGGNYAYSVIPHSVDSLYATYTSDPHPWGKAGATFGVTYVSKTQVLVQNGVTFPDYAVANASAFYDRGPYEIAVNVDNVFDKLYFTPDADTYVNLAALPSTGRIWRVTLKRKF